MRNYDGGVTSEAVRGRPSAARLTRTPSIVDRLRDADSTKIPFSVEFSPPRDEAAEARPSGGMGAGKAAEVQPEVDAMEQTTEEQPSKKPKVYNSGKVDMDLEALAHRIDAAPSAEALLGWQAAGWR